MSGLTIRWAAPEDLPTVWEVLHAVAEALHREGYDQWPHNSPSLSPEKLGGQIRRNEMLILADDRDPVGVIGVAPKGDPEFWGVLRQLQSSVYISKAAVLRHRKGEGLGALMTRWCMDWAWRHGIPRGRLDVWKTNPHLQQKVWQAQGWRHVRTVDLPHRKSGVLFQKRARPDPEARAAITCVPTPAAGWSLSASGVLPEGCQVIAANPWPAGPVSAVVVSSCQDHSMPEVAPAWAGGSGGPPVLYLVRDSTGRVWVPQPGGVWLDPAAVAENTARIYNAA